MKTLFKLTIITLVLCLSFSSIAVYSAANVIKINGIVAEIPEGMGQIREKDDRTFVPLRFVLEFLKNDVWYMDSTKSANIESEYMLFFVQDGNTSLYCINKSTGERKDVLMDTSAYIDPTENRMYLPIRFLAEAMGYTVGWDEVTETVTLDKSE